MRRWGEVPGAAGLVLPSQGQVGRSGLSRLAGSPGGRSLLGPADRGWPVRLSRKGLVGVGEESWTPGQPVPRPGPAGHAPGPRPSAREGGWTLASGTAAPGPPLTLLLGRCPPTSSSPSATPGFPPTAGPRALLSLHAALHICWPEKPACAEM